MTEMDQMRAELARAHRRIDDTTEALLQLTQALVAVANQSTPGTVPPDVKATLSALADRIKQRSPR